MNDLYFRGKQVVHYGLMFLLVTYLYHTDPVLTNTRSEIYALAIFGVILIFAIELVRMCTILMNEFIKFLDSRWENA